MCINVKEKSTAEMKTVSVGQMFKALIQNDQALTVVVAIVLINCAIYITSNLVIAFFFFPKEIYSDRRQTERRQQTDRGNAGE